MELNVPEIKKTRSVYKGVDEHVDKELSGCNRDIMEEFRES